MSRAILVGLALASLMLTASATYKSPVPKPVPKPAPSPDRDDAYDGNFPYCRCKDYKPTSSPYAFEIASESTVGSTFKICFTMGKNAAVTSGFSECYETLSSSLDRLEFYTKPECKAAIKAVTISDVAYPSTRTQFITGTDGAAVKLVKLGMSTASLEKTVCIEAEAPCNSFEKLLATEDGCFMTSVSESGNHECCPVQKWCPAPPPPAPRTPNEPANPPPPSPTPSPVFKADEFPHRCYPGNPELGGGVGTGLLEVPISLVGTSAETVSNGMRYCLAAKSKTCKADGPSKGVCCNMPVDKIEFVTAGEQCRGSIVDVLINGVKSSVSYSTQEDSKGVKKLVAKFTKLSWEAGKQDGNEICLTLLSTKTCNTIDKFSGIPGFIQFAYFNGNAYKNSCCGTDVMSTSG